MLAAAELLEEEFACRRTCSASRASRSCAVGARRRALEPAASRRSSPHALREPVSGGTRRPIRRSTDYMRTVPDQVRQWVPDAITCSARMVRTQRFARGVARLLRGRSALRRACGAKALADEGRLDLGTVRGAIARFGSILKRPTRDGVGLARGRAGRNPRSGSGRLQGLEVIDVPSRPVMSSPRKRRSSRSRQKGHDGLAFTRGRHDQELKIKRGDRCRKAT